MLARARQFFVEAMGFIRRHHWWSLGIAFIWLLTSGFVANIADKILYDPITGPLLAWLSELVGDQWPMRLAPYVAYLQSLIAVGIAMGVAAACAWRLKDRPVPVQVRVASKDEPDWPLHELFSYIDPHVLDEERWHGVGQEIRDALGLGRLKSWGRVWIKNGPISDTQQWPTPQEIPEAYWRFATFTYTFFDPTRGPGEPDTYPGQGTGDPHYFDVRVNEARAREVWPQTSPDDRYVDLKEAAIQAYEACRHLISGQLAESMAEGDDDSVVTWYCWSLWERTSIFGSHPPSRKIEQISRGLKNSHTFKVKNGTLVFENRYRYGASGRYTNLKVLADELPNAIANMKTRDKEIEGSWDQK